MKKLIVIAVATALASASCDGGPDERIASNRATSSTTTTTTTTIPPLTLPETVIPAGPDSPWQLAGLIGERTDESYITAAVENPGGSEAALVGAVIADGTESAAAWTTRDGEFARSDGPPRTAALTGAWRDGSLLVAGVVYGESESTNGGAVWDVTADWAPVGDPLPTPIIGLVAAGDVLMAYTELDLDIANPEDGYDLWILEDGTWTAASTRSTFNTMTAAGNAVWGVDLDARDLTYSALRSTDGAFWSPGVLDGETPQLGLPVDIAGAPNGNVVMANQFGERMDVWRFTGGWDKIEVDIGGATVESVATDGETWFALLDLGFPEGFVLVDGDFESDSVDAVGRYTTSIYRYSDIAIAAEGTLAIVNTRGTARPLMLDVDAEIPDMVDAALGFDDTFPGGADFAPEVLIADGQGLVAGGFSVRPEPWDAGRSTLLAASTDAGVTWGAAGEISAAPTQLQEGTSWDGGLILVGFTDDAGIATEQEGAIDALAPVILTSTGRTNWQRISPTDMGLGSEVTIVWDVGWNGSTLTVTGTTIGIDAVTSVAVTSTDGVAWERTAADPFFGLPIAGVCETPGEPQLLISAVGASSVLTGDNVYATLAPARGGRAASEVPLPEWLVPLGVCEWDGNSYLVIDSEDDASLRLTRLAGDGSPQVLFQQAMRWTDDVVVSSDGDGETTAFAVDTGDESGVLVGPVNGDWAWVPIELPTPSEVVRLSVVDVQVHEGTVYVLFRAGTASGVATLDLRRVDP